MSAELRKFNLAELNLAANQAIRIIGCAKSGKTTLAKQIVAQCAASIPVANRLCFTAEQLNGFGTRIVYDSANGTRDEQVKLSKLDSTWAGAVLPDNIHCGSHIDSEKALPGTPALVVIDDTYDRDILYRTDAMQALCCREGTTTVAISQLPLRMTDQIRANLRFTVIFKADRTTYNRIWAMHPALMAAVAFPAFYAIAETCCKDFGCLVIDHEAAGTPEDCLYWFKANLQ